MSERKTLPFGDWPEADRTAWEAAFAAANLFDGRGPAAHWSLGSRTSVRSGYSRWLGYVRAVQPNVLDLPPADRANPNHIESYVEVLRAEVSPTTVWNYVKHLYDALRVMAPRRDWSWLKAVAANLELEIRPAAKRHRMVDADRLLDLGLRLMDGADLDGGALAGPIQYRDGLLIALLASRPIRRRTIALMRLDQHLVKIGKRYVLCFERTDVKNKRPVEFYLPERLTCYIDDYVGGVRPRFPGAGSHEGVWASAKGGPMHPEALNDAVKRRTAAAFGHGINLHLFRDCAATTLAVHDPSHVACAKDVLGHSDSRTTERHYNQARSLEASRSYNATLEALANDLTERRRRCNRR